MLVRNFRPEGSKVVGIDTQGLHHLHKQLQNLAGRSPDLAHVATLLACRRVNWRGPHLRQAIPPQLAKGSVRAAWHCEVEDGLSAAETELEKPMAVQVPVSDPWLALYVAILRHDLPQHARRCRAELEKAEIDAVQVYPRAQGWLQTAIGRLVARQRLILGRRFGLEIRGKVLPRATYAALAKHYCVTPSAISRPADRALSRLRAQLARFAARQPDLAPVADLLSYRHVVWRKMYPSRRRVAS